MPRKAGLRAVAEGEKAPAPEPEMSLAEAVASGVYMDILKAQRREIADSIPSEKGPAKAALHRQLSLISKEIEGLEAARGKEVDGDELQGESAWDAAAI